MPSCPRSRQVLLAVKGLSTLPVRCLFSAASTSIILGKSFSLLGSIAGPACVLFPLIVQFAALLFSHCCCCSPLLSLFFLLLCYSSLFFSLSFPSRQRRRHFNSFMILLARSSFSFALIFLRLLFSPLLCSSLASCCRCVCPILLLRKLNCLGHWRICCKSVFLMQHVPSTTPPCPLLTHTLMTPTRYQLQALHTSRLCQQLLLRNFRLKPLSQKSHKLSSKLPLAACKPQIRIQNTRNFKKS